MKQLNLKNIFPKGIQNYNLSRKTLVFLSTFSVALIATAIVLIIPITSTSKNKENAELYIQSGDSFSSVSTQLREKGILKGTMSFRILSTVRKYPSHIKSGHYEVAPHTRLFKLVNKLYHGNEDAVKLVIRKQRTPELMAQFLSEKLMVSKEDFLAIFQNDSLLQGMGTDKENVIALFIPNTYFVYWSTSPEKLLARMKSEYDKFWNQDRLSQADNLGLSPKEICIVASIVDEETNMSNEKPQIASVYLNRLKKGMPLQADPTLKFAAGDFSIKRLTSEHIRIPSPYNTYQNKGLMPGPICNPSPVSIDAVLKGLNTSYLYFCAKEDFSGYHNFASTLAEHQKNAIRFHKALNERGIK